ncbi:hypothetical protein ACAG11_26485, partial [Escherichia coli]|uniref:hypothetical protein n=1 Tax=Escherichia coli TaxID=562 RepID=UPI003FA105CF
MSNRILFLLLGGALLHACTPSPSPGENKPNTSVEAAPADATAIVNQAARLPGFAGHYIENGKVYLGFTSGSTAAARYRSDPRVVVFTA